MSAKRPTIEYAPGLDGVRGICLIGVLFFHAPFAWMSGGFLGVSTFFTLSGYLITTLLMAEVERSGRIDHAAFWERRLRRLGPPLWLGVAATVFTAPYWVAPAALERLGGDALSALLFYSNWRFMTPEYAYSRLFTDPSTMQHCWSLAIEAQYYLLFPPLIAPVLRRYGVGSLRAAILFLVVASVASGWLSDSAYRLYYGTDTRAVEILAGALMATLLPPRAAAAALSQRRWFAIAGAGALAAIIACWMLAAVDSPPLYAGGFAAYSALSVVLILAAVSASGPVGTLLSAAPLRWVGRISYGAYVFHWPIFLWLSPERTQLDAAPLFALRVALTLALADASYRLVETPVRQRRVAKSGRLLAAVSIATAVLVSGVAAVRHSEDWRLRIFGLVGGVNAIRNPSPQTLFRVSLFGDSTAFELSGMLKWTGVPFGLEFVGGKAQIGCSLIDRGTVLTWMGEHRLREECSGWLASWPDVVEEHRPDVAVVLVGPWEVRDRRLPGQSRIRAFGDQIFDAEFRIAVETAIRLLRRNGVKVVWLTFPRLQFAAVRNGVEHQSEIHASDPARIRRMNAIITEVAREHSDQVRIVDFAAFMEAWPGGPLAPGVRPDGVHFAAEVREPIARWIAEEVAGAARELYPDGVAPPAVEP